MDKTTALAKAVRDSILSDVYGPGSMLPSERALMTSYGLSRTTVRRAVQQLVDEGIVVRRAGSGSFVTGRRVDKRGARDTKAELINRTITLVIPTFSNPLYAEVIDGIEQSARAVGVKLVASQSEYSEGNETDQLKAMANTADVLGAIVVPTSVEKPSLGASAFIKTGKPLVFLGRWPDQTKADGVSIDHAAAGNLAVRHLMELGHRKIAYVEGLPRLPRFSMDEAYKRTLQSGQVSAKLVRVYDLESEQAGYQAVVDMDVEGVEFTAIFARNDVTAIGVYRALRESGRSIPADVSVVSVNDSMIARSLSPALTSVNVHPKVLGYLAFKTLNERMLGHYDGPPINLSLAPTLSIHNSTDRLNVVRTTTV